jgi:hypothetical protein
VSVALRVSIRQRWTARSMILRRWIVRGGTFRPGDEICEILPRSGDRDLFFFHSGRHWVYKGARSSRYDGMEVSRIGETSCF